jgi:beta-glucanase (GH16 family)
VNGFGTGSFEWTTNDSKNVYVDSSGLHIVPTLTKDTTPITDQQIMDGYTLNLTKSADGDGTCTGDTVIACSQRSNATEGSVISPVRSARINTKGKKSIKYGKVEVTAKLPRGDWLWPAICQFIRHNTYYRLLNSLGMMPEDSVYGPWPASGEIDIMESRGNDVRYNVDGHDRGRDVYSSTLHWGSYIHHSQFKYI